MPSIATALIPRPVQIDTMPLSMRLRCSRTELVGPTASLAVVLGRSGDQVAR